MTLVQVGQIALHGIVRAPARVRAVSWILPDHQLRKLSDQDIDVLANSQKVTAILRRTSSTLRSSSL